MGLGSGCLAFGGFGVEGSGFGFWLEGPGLRV